MPKDSNRMPEKLRDLIDQETAATEAAQGQEWEGPLPDHVTVSRPGRARSKVLQVRLNPEEFDALEQIAAQRELPVSTVAREQLLGLIAREAQSGETQAQELIWQLTMVTDRLRAVLHVDGMPDPPAVKAEP
jgi:hypothetical protein